MKGWDSGLPSPSAEFGQTRRRPLPTWPAGRGNQGSAGPTLTRDPRPAGPGGALGPPDLSAGPQPAPAERPGAPARTYLHVFVLVFALPAVPAGRATARDLPHRVLHRERVRVYGREGVALVHAWERGRHGPHSGRNFCSPQESESPAAAAVAAAISSRDERA